MTISSTLPAPATPPSTTFGIEVDSVSTSMIVVRVSGEVDLLTVPHLSKALEQVSEYSEALIDLSAVSFMTSTGVDTVMDAYDRCTGALQIFAPTEPARGVLELLVGQSVNLDG